MKTNNMFTATFNFTEEGVNELVSMISNRVMANLSETMRTIADLLSEEVKVTKESISTIVRKEVVAAIGTSVTPATPVESKKNDVKPESSGNVSGNEDDFNLVAMAIQNYCRDIIRMVLSGNKDAAANSTEEILRMSNGRVHARIAFCRGACFSFADTPEMHKLHPYKWNGLVSTENIAEELIAAFSIKDIKEKNTVDEIRDSSTVSHRKNRPLGISNHQNTYTRVERGSNLFKMRFDKNGKIMPMVIDKALAEELMNNNYTHVTLTKSTNGKDLFMVFTESDKKTIAPHNSPIISRLNIYGYNHKDGSPTTFSISSHNFLKTIMNHFNLKAAPGKEFFLTFDNGTSGVHNSNGHIFSSFSGKKYRSIRLDVAK